VDRPFKLVSPHHDGVGSSLWLPSPSVRARGLSRRHTPGPVLLFRKIQTAHELNVSEARPSPRRVVALHDHTCQAQGPPSPCRIQQPQRHHSLRRARASSSSSPTSSSSGNGSTSSGSSRLSRSPHLSHPTLLPRFPSASLPS
jgi:hypothetical protein